MESNNCDVEIPSIRRNHPSSHSAAIFCFIHRCSSSNASSSWILCEYSNSYNCSYFQRSFGSVVYRSYTSSNCSSITSSKNSSEVNDRRCKYSSPSRHFEGEGVLVLEFAFSSRFNSILYKVLLSEGRGLISTAHVNESEMKRHKLSQSTLTSSASSMARVGPRPLPH